MTRRRSLFRGGLFFVLLLIALTAWVGVRALLARQHLLDARHEISLLREEVSAGRLDALDPGLAKVEADARSAKSLTSDPIWAGLASLPVIGRTLATTTHLADSVDELSSSALQPLLAASHQLDPHELRRADGTIDLARLAATAPDLSRAQAALATVRTQIDRVPTSGIVGPVVKARNAFVSQLNGLASTVDTAYRAARVAPAMLGANGPRRYLMVFQTPAESRGTGGLVGSYAIRCSGSCARTRLTGKC